MLPTQKGLSLNEQQWRALVDSIKQVDECLADMNERVKDLPPVPNTGNSNGYYNNKRTYNRNTYSRSNNPENNIPFQLYCFVFNKRGKKIFTNRLDTENKGTNVYSRKRDYRIASDEGMSS